MALTFDIDPTTALNRGLDRFQITWTNVGNTGTGADAESLATDSQNYSLAGLAIAPGSTPYVELQIRSVGSPPFSSSQTLTPTAPYIGDIAAPWQASLGAFGRFGDLYTPLGGVATAPFGQTMGNDPGGNIIFGGRPLGNFPSITLIAYLRPPSSVFLADTQLSNTPSGSFTAVAAGTNVVRVLAVPRRRRLRAVFKAGSGGTFSVQITGSLGQNASIREFVLPGGGPVALAASGEGVLDVDTLDARWIFIKTVFTAGNPTIGWELLAT